MTTSVVENGCPDADCEISCFIRDDNGLFDNTGAAGGPSWVCTNCGNRITW